MLEFRDVRWLSSTKYRIAFLKAEENRVATLRKLCENLLERVKKYLRKVIDEDPAGSSRLEGNVYHLRTQNNSQARLVYDPEKWKETVPVKFHQQSIAFTVSCDAVGMDTIETLKKFELAYDDDQLKMIIGNPVLNEKLVRETLKGGENVPGAKLVPGRHLRDSAPKTEVVKL